MFKWLGQQTEKTKQKTKRLWEKEFKIVENGLDEKQVVSFVDELTRQNKMPQKASNASLNSILKKAIAEAEQIVNSIKTRAQAEAEDEAAKIVSQAKQEAEEIKSKAEIAIEKQLEDILAGISRNIKVAEVEPPVQLQKETKKEKVKEKKVEPTLQLKEEAKKEKVEPPTQPKEEAEEKKIKPPAPLREEAEEKKIEPTLQLKEEAPVSEAVEVTEERLTEESLEQKESDKKETVSASITADSQALYAGEIELTIATPVELKMVSKFYDYLQTINQLRILRTTGSWDQGTTITVVLEKPAPLLNIISKMPGVRDIEVTPELAGRDDSVKKISSSLLARRKGREAKVIRLTLKEA